MSNQCELQTETDILQNFTPKGPSMFLVRSVPLSPPSSIENVIHSGSGEILRLKRMRRNSSATTGPESGEAGGPEDEDVTYYTNSQSPINLPPHGWTTADLEHATIGESALFVRNLHPAMAMNPVTSAGLPTPLLPR